MRLSRMPAPTSSAAPPARCGRLAGAAGVAATASVTAAQDTRPGPGEAANETSNCDRELPQRRALHRVRGGHRVVLRVAVADDGLLVDDGFHVHRLRLRRRRPGDADRLRIA